MALGILSRRRAKLLQVQILQVSEGEAASGGTAVEVFVEDSHAKNIAEQRHIVVTGNANVSGQAADLVHELMNIQ